MWRQRLPRRCKRRSCRYGAIACTRLAIGLILLLVAPVGGRRGAVVVGICRFLVVLGLMRGPEVFQWLGLERVLDKMPIRRIYSETMQQE